MNARRLRSELRRTPLPEAAAAEERSWEVVRAAFAAREPAPAARSRRLPLALALAALAVAVVAAALSPPGRAVVDAVRRTIGVEHAAPALFRLPASGRLLVAGESGTWVVAPDGSKRLLGDYREASWSPHGLFLAAAGQDELAALEPGGRLHWSLARPDLRFPRWGGTRTDTRIAYLTGSKLRVVAGDGTGDAALCAGDTAKASVAPAWRPGVLGKLAYATAAGRIELVDTGSCATLWRSPRLGAARSLAWSHDGRRLAAALPGRVAILDGATGSTTSIPVPGVRTVAFAPDGRLALLRANDVLLLGRSPESPPRTLFAGGGRLDGEAWSPDGRWLLVGLPGADEWVFLRTVGAREIVAVGRIRAQFGAFPALAGWCCAR